ncbi:hypothetical protein ACCAA_790033 [Candidatus Accumulibacter aalborgensis]|uniref:Uncharacterized protein n=1 Tax=Candidatus Accumulibacter aalborgensis TaxID=1860102 RepID=A0A1A8XYT4_9PROT|nr:hypothetical protein ACCAA_790033 [Candidatus Accumulibacter aalborgensis]
MLPAVQTRTNLAAEMLSLHGSKRDTAALTATHQHIAPTPRKGCATPGCIRPQPALDPATGRRFRAAQKQFLRLGKVRRQNSTFFDRHRQRAMVADGAMVSVTAALSGPMFSSLRGRSEPGVWGSAGQLDRSLWRVPVALLGASGPLHRARVSEYRMK